MGDTLKVEVLNIDLEARKIGLSVKQIQLRGDQKNSSAEETEKPAEEKSAGEKKKTDSFFGRALKASLLGKTSNGEKSADSSSE